MENEEKTISEEKVTEILRQEKEINKSESKLNLYGKMSSSNLLENQQIEKEKDRIEEEDNLEENVLEKAEKSEKNPELVQEKTCTFNDAPSDSIPADSRPDIPLEPKIQLVEEERNEKKKRLEKKLSASSESSIEDRFVKKPNIHREKRRVGRNVPTKTSERKLEDRCKCEDIREDPRLKTKVCIIL